MEVLMMMLMTVVRRTVVTSSVTSTVTSSVVGLLELMNEVPDFVNKSVVRGDVKIHQRFDDLFSVLVLRDLNGKKRVDTDQAKVETVTSHRAVVRVDSRVRTVGVDRVTASSSSRETKGKTESRAEFQPGTIGV